ncbi:3-hydroxybutyryl-CoA dehydrogenase [Neptunomonas marina]|uniref:3-hydroxybutyryl-CoA dehydrogenase n=1 Tax=Neptunomonas marina TaxID=1815562 RepID=A0A437QBI4_9GAMM|nr:3-hydroxybutyryl-CoA dehydrogenase [Neptunomonas marina]RVU31703.1 3-hydroxybutyryl-CoA dehydrogenase [Neptunomonas marina]
MSISTVGVIGAGQMGNGIAQSMAMAGLEVILNDIDGASIERALATIQKSLTRMESKGKLSEPAEQVMGRIKTSTELSALAQTQLVVEAVSENEALKKSLFKQLDELCPAETILASNTSSISITRIAAATNRPDQVIGMHFMNPVPVMKLVEVIRGLQTSDEVNDKIVALVEQLGKVAVGSEDRPGFIVNRILLPMINEAVFALYEGVGEAKAIDDAMKLGTAHPMGPLELADMIGLDTCLSIMEVLYEGFRDSKYRPCPLLRSMVDAGYLGRKSGQGFYSYE